MTLGTCPIEDLAHSPKADLEGFDLPNLPSDFELLQPLSKPPPDAGPVVSDDKESLKVPSSMQFVAQLHQTCVSAFGNSEALKFEFLEETGLKDRRMFCFDLVQLIFMLFTRSSMNKVAHSSLSFMEVLPLMILVYLTFYLYASARLGKRCILTITRPNGQIRSYTTAAEFSRKSDAKARAAAIAVEMGAVDFILHGNKDASSAKLLLAPLDSSVVSRAELKKEGSSESEVVIDNESKQIEDLCLEWRAGKIQPQWVFFKEQRASSSWGCAMIIELSPHCQRLYSVDPQYSSMPLAKKACSEAALQDDVVDFIKHGNGQTAPPPALLDPLNDIMKRESDLERKGRIAAISLQSFFDSLPKPFPEQIGDKPIANLNIPGMLNTTLQLAKGSRLHLRFYFLSENGLHGSIMRLERPGETKTYMVEPRFAKRSDAKAAVCLQAMSQGVSKYIRSLADAVDSKITDEMRRLANEQILPILGSEYGRLRHGMHPVYDYGFDNGAFSCTMTLSLSSDPKPGEMRTWTVKPEYRTKTDAKIAVVCAAGGEAIEFVRFRGQPAPPGHDPFKHYKRSDAIDQRTSANSKHSAASGQARLGPPRFETKEQAMARKKPTAKWDRTCSSISRTHRYQPTYARSATRPTTLNYGHGSLRKGLSLPGSSSGLGFKAGASAQITSASRTHHNHSQRNQNTGPSHSHEYSKEAIARLRPPRKSQLHHQAHQASPSQQPSPANSQPTQQDTQQPVPQQPVPQTVPPQPTPPSQQFMPYGTAPQPQQPAQYQSSVYSSTPYPGTYVQPPYPYPVPQLTTYQSPANTYPYPMPPAPPAAPLAYGAPSYHAYPAYYTDPRYAQYAQYNMPGAPTPYAVPMPPNSGMQYPTPPMPSMAPTPTTPSISTQVNSSLPTPPTSSDAERPASAHWIEIERSSKRTASYSTEDHDREKRPRSRDMSMSPDDVQMPKKHRSEPPKGQTNVKRETVSTLPVPTAPPTPVSTSHVQQLLRYCESESLSSPEFGSKQVKNERGEEEFKVWIVMGKERLELPVTFTSENEGRQRVAKQVLQRLRSQAVKK
ncbi:hypothetical protein ACEPAH_9454 [Sanghuangporus vaninii]